MQVSHPPSSDRSLNNGVVGCDGAPTLYKQSFSKPDGRSITLYSRSEIQNIGPILTPRPQAVRANPHMRWHPLRDEWIVYSSYRQERSLTATADYDPLLPSDDEERATEVPIGDYDIAVFDNLYPDMTPAAREPPPLKVPSMPGLGKCEVVAFTQQPEISLADLEISHMELLMQVWADRTCEIAANESIKSVLPFVTRTVQAGVAQHPHGEIYAYSVTPPIQQRMQDSESAYFYRHRRAMLQDLIAQEVTLDKRIVYEGEHAVAFVPPWARYPYEVWIAPRIAAGFLHDLDAAQRFDCALAIKTVLMKYDGLWQRSMPYVLAWFQAATDNRPHPEAHIHVEIYPALRAKDKFKRFIGAETASGLFINDVLPETAAAQLQAVPAVF